MTSFEPIPVPPDLGQVLAFPGLYLEAPADLAAPARAPRTRRPGRIRRGVAALVAGTAAAVLALGGCGAVHPVPATVASPVSAQPQRPVWDGAGSYPDNGVEPLCRAADAGNVATVGTGSDAFRVVCAWDGSEYAWGVVAGGAK